MVEAAAIARAEVELGKLLGMTPVWNCQLAEGYPCPATGFSIVRYLFVSAFWPPKLTAGSC